MSEHDDSDGGMPPPDWERYQVRSRAQDNTGKSHTPLGDPLRWGGQVDQLVVSPLVSAGFVSNQFLRVQTMDTYPRLWALIGAVTAHDAVWALAAGLWRIVLQVTQGAGQNALTQAFDLRTLTDLGVLGGYAIESSLTLDAVPPQFQRRSFAIIGGVVGQQFGARVVQVFAGDPGVTSNVITSAIVTPLAAGTGL